MRRIIMNDRKNIEKKVNLVQAEGWPFCVSDAKKALKSIEGLEHGRVVKYEGSIGLYKTDGTPITVQSHALATTDSGLFIDINQPVGKRIFSSGREYWRDSGNSIKRANRV